jgi:hypothetical protein
MAEKGSGSSGSTTVDTERVLERERTKNAHYSSVDSSEMVSLVGSGEFGEISAGEGGISIRSDDDDDHDEEASNCGASSCGEVAEDNEEEEEEDCFAETETHRDLYRHLEDDIDAALEKELDEQMEAMWDEYSNDMHAEIQNELDQALQQQLDEQFDVTYSRVEVQLEEDWDFQQEDEFEHELSSQRRYEREELEPLSTRQFTPRFQVEPSSVESINALIQQVIEKHRPKLER